jgi:hypothetical protein
VTDLKHCPFCGFNPNSGCNYGIGGSYVNCINKECACNPEVFVAAIHNSDASLSLENALVRAKVSWNTRADDNILTEAIAALDYLLQQTIDQDLKHGITLTEGEEDARRRALAVIAKVTA